MLTTLIGGKPTTASLTAPSDCACGQVVDIGNTPVIATHAVKSGAVGTFAIGGGVYSADAQTSTGAPVAGSKCNFATNIKAGTVAGTHFGVALSVSAASCVVLHAPSGTASA